MEIPSSPVSGVQVGTTVTRRLLVLMFVLLCVGFVLGALGVVVLRPRVPTPAEPSTASPSIAPVLQRVDLPRYGISFEYPSGVDGYDFSSFGARTLSTQPNIVDQFRLVPHAEAIAWAEDPGAVGSAPWIDVRIYQTLQPIPLEAWMTDSGLFNETVADVRTIQVGGADALRFRMQGSPELNELMYTLVPRGSTLVIIEGQVGPKHISEYEALVRSIELYPPVTPRL